MKHKFLKSLFLLLIFSITFDNSQATAKRIRPISEIPVFSQSPNTTTPRSKIQQVGPHVPHTTQKPTFPFVFAGILAFTAAVISSAGGIGGGGLFIPILTIVAGLDLKTASSFSAFMVTGGSTANVAGQIFAGIRKKGGKSKTLTTLNIVLLSEPCMLLGVSCGVICNQVFPEWLITVLFAVFLAFSTFKTWRSGVLYWKLESEGCRGNGCVKFGSGDDDGCDGGSIKVPLLSEELRKGLKMPWMKLGMLVIIWFSFLLLYLIRGNRYGQGFIHIQACGRVYWILSSIQIPLAVAFTAWILYGKDGLNIPSSVPQDDGGEINPCWCHKLAFPIMALLAGILGGFFGIGGGMLISPLLLQLGMEPEVTAATCSLMVFFSATMSSIQYLLLGMEDLHGALTYAVLCFVASIVGLTLVQRAIKRHGRASLIVFSVGTVMALSTVLITSFGARDIWRDFSRGKSMGFKPPC